MRWDGWRNYNSDDYYARLCLSFDVEPERRSRSRITAGSCSSGGRRSCRLKTSRAIRSRRCCAAGWTKRRAISPRRARELLDPEARAQIDRAAARADRRRRRSANSKSCSPSRSAKTELREEDEARLYERGGELGLARDEMQGGVDAELERLGARRGSTPRPAPRRRRSAATRPQRRNSADMRRAIPFTEFRRMLRLSRLCLDGDEMTDDQRDAMCNMGESLGLTGGQAEDLIDEYLEEASGHAARPRWPRRRRARSPPPAPWPRPSPRRPSPRPTAAPQPIIAGREPRSIPRRWRARRSGRSIPISPTPSGIEMLLVPSGSSSWAATRRTRRRNEQPSRTSRSAASIMARFPVTNAQYEKFDPAHIAQARAVGRRRSSGDLCEQPRGGEILPMAQLARRAKNTACRPRPNGNTPRAALDGRIFPWGDALDAGHFANFADKRTNFAWRDTHDRRRFCRDRARRQLSRGARVRSASKTWRATSSSGASIFSSLTRARSASIRAARQWATSGIYRGGSWKSRAASLRAPAAHFNLPDYSSNDVGFRVLCECEA